MSIRKILRFGILGAARIAPLGIIEPAQKTEGAVVNAIASRNIERAQSFAKKYHVPKVFENYDDLIHEPDIDAIYNALPNSLHCEWSIKALYAGKHVLCEKPLACNTEEAERMTHVAAEKGKMLVEAFHYRYHPLAFRMKEIIDQGLLGKILWMRSHFTVPVPDQNNIRFNYSLGGGSTMDLGSYLIHMSRHIIGEEPQVVIADAKIIGGKIDVAMRAELTFPNGTRGYIRSSMESTAPLSMEIEIGRNCGKGVQGPYHRCFPG
ncbi:Gfo/Idh/MocA family protein [Thermodesulfobacteriota bacterium]